MKLIDLLSVISEGTWVNVWQDGDIIATYDGKDAIDADLNACDVLQVRGGSCGNRIDVYI